MYVLNFLLKKSITGLIIQAITKPNMQGLTKLIIMQQKFNILHSLIINNSSKIFARNKKIFSSFKFLILFILLLFII